MMNDAKIVAIVERGLKKVTNSELVNGYYFCTGKPLAGNCSGCTKRKGWNAIYDYYTKLIKTTQ